MVLKLLKFIIFKIKLFHFGSKDISQMASVVLVTTVTLRTMPTDANQPCADTFWWVTAHMAIVVFTSIQLKLKCQEEWPKGHSLLNRQWTQSKSRHSKWRLIKHSFGFVSFILFKVYFSMIEFILIITAYIDYWKAVNLCITRSN